MTLGPYLHFFLPFFLSFSSPICFCCVLGPIAIHVSEAIHTLWVLGGEAAQLLGLEWGSGAEIQKWGEGQWAEHLAQGWSFCLLSPILFLFIIDLFDVCPTGCQTDRLNTF